MKILVAIFLLWASLAVAQTTVTGVIQDPSGAVATSGYVQFTLAPSLSNVQYYVLGTTVITPRTVRCGINGSGQVKNLALSGACIVYGNDIITPVNTSYTVAYAPGNVVTSTITGNLITGASYSLNSPVFQPPIAPSQSSSVYTTPVNWNIIPSSNNIFSIGSAVLKYLSVYATTVNTDRTTNVQTLQTTACITGSTPNSPCSSTLSWGTAWADTNYTVSCTISTVASGNPYIYTIGTKSTTGFVLWMAPLTAAVSAANVNCIGVKNAT